MSRGAPEVVRLGRRIRLARERANLGAGELGVAVGLSEAEVAAIEAGQRRPRVAQLRAIAIVCGTSAAGLLAESRPPPEALDAPEWHELGAIFARLDDAARADLVRHARALLGRPAEG